MGWIDIQKQSEWDIRKLKQKEIFNLPYEKKVLWAKEKIREFLEQFPNSYIAFSGGKDSSVLLHLVRSIKTDCVAIFSDTTMELPEIYSHINNTQNVITNSNNYDFKDIWEKKGYPLVSKQIALKVNRFRNTKKAKNYNFLNTIIGNGKFKISKKYHHLLDKEFFKWEISEQCCHYFKNNNCGSNLCLKENTSFVGTRANESKIREQNWVQYGCNVYKGNKDSISRPLSIWSDRDIDKYIKDNNVPIAKCYLGFGGNENRTGCITCPLGAQLETLLANKKPEFKNRFERLKEKHPNLYEKYIKKSGLWKLLPYSYIKIRNDSTYMTYYNLVQELIKKWYGNYDQNMNRIIFDYIERVGLNNE